MGKSDSNRKDVEGNGNGLPWKWPEKWMETCLHNIYIYIYIYIYSTNSKIVLLKLLKAF